ncbi:uncharacterized protein LOC124146633 [Haliotis rufescens]|uniref:uncharacterized protein LOC124146633 n=1 Tax=Haliotis rufescens TaxID=6454 RepID=UPI00201EC86F|nr:uncharacterized protein LOC124146633 [Haliotis rufescens]
MLDVPTHLLQTLSINTNITYDLDMSKFPGLDDPQHMYQPALLIATDWSDYVYHDAPCVTHDANSVSSSHESDGVLESDLYSLIESTDALLTDQGFAVDDITMQTLLDDVLADSVIPSDIFGLIDLDTDSQSSLSTSDSPQTDHTTPNIGLTCSPDMEELLPVRTCGRGQKRRLSDDACYPDVEKRSKMMESFTQALPYLVVNLCHESKNGGIGRES